jgi:iron-sulfur cluster repair protein YtfE (RIC family)
MGIRMTRVTQPLREEHEELIPHIEALRAVAESVADAPLEAVRRDVGRAEAFLVHHLLPHAEAEEAALYPVVARVMGAPEATRTMSRDHVEVGRLVGELTALRGRLDRPALGAAEVEALRRVLYGLYAVVRLHFVKEEEVYLPLLDARLDRDAARAMFEAMEAAARTAKAARAGGANATG